MLKKILKILGMVLVLLLAFALFALSSLSVPEKSDFAVDWENSGIGSPATDLARFPSECELSDFVAAPSITAYWSRIRHHWPGLSRTDLREMANVGLVFRCLSAIQWEIERLDANGYRVRCMPRLVIFRDGLKEAITIAGWND